MVRTQENLRFRRFLKAHHCSEDPLHAAAARLQPRFDCTRCANCCRETEVEVSPADLHAIARYLDLSPEETLRRYTRLDPRDHRRLLLQAHGECCFLDHNLCLVYDARPSVCRDFPHLLTPGRSLGGRLASICRRADYCPIVYNALEEFKRRVGFRCP